MPIPDLNRVIAWDFARMANGKQFSRRTVFSPSIDKLKDKWRR